MDGWMDEWLAGWMDGMDGRMHAWMDRHVHLDRKIRFPLINKEFRKYEAQKGKRKKKKKFISRQGRRRRRR